MTTTDLLAEYRRLAERLTLADGSRPLMRTCEYCRNGWYPDWPSAEKSECMTCDSTGYVPRLDLRDGQPVVPLDLIEQALWESGFHVKLLRLRNDGRWSAHVYEARSFSDDSQSTILIEAVLAAANAALDAREAKT